MDLVINHLRDITIAVIGALSGAAITFRIMSNKNSNNDNSNKVNQQNSKVAGDQAGRDIKKR